jgi:dimethylaniline monooxygenase (N-oxide forming)
VEGEISLDLLVRLGRGDIVPKRGIKWLQGGLVRFVGGSAVEADAIIYCTGYKVSFPILDPGFLAVPGNDLSLWRSSARRGRPLLHGPFAATRSNYAACRGKGEAARRAAGRALRPALSRAMRANMERERRRMFARYVALERQTMQVDFDRAPRATPGLSTARVRFPCPIRLHQLRC